MSTVPSDPLGPPLQPPSTDKFNPMTGLGEAQIGPPNIGVSPPGAYQAEPTTGLGKGGPPGQPYGPQSPFRAPIEK